MRVAKSHHGLTVHAVAGTYVVLLGFDLRKEDCDGLLGFSIHRRDAAANEARWLEGMKCFAQTDPGFPSGAVYPTNEHPIQSFQWSDYSAKPGHDYTYTVAALKGAPGNLEPFAEVAIDITTESPENGDHDVYFNRGVAASQEYARRFGDRRPEDVPNNKAFEWLSRGLYEAMEAFVARAEPGRHALRIAAYEFQHLPLLKLLAARRKAGVDIEIIYDARNESPREKNREAAAGAKIKKICAERTTNTAISHNKFIVLLDGGAPSAVWTGGTNFSTGGIFGHSNVAHVVEEPAVASKYLEYWELLRDDPDFGALRPQVEALSPVPALPPPQGTSVVLSPRAELDALDYYAALGMSACEGLFMTFAFGMNDVFQSVYRNGKAPCRFALMEAATRSMKDGPERKAEQAKIQALRKMPENTFAIGSFIRTNELDGWLKEKLSGLNKNVKYVHNKFMLVDPLSDDPIVVAGSANFSKASTRENDENMLVIRGNKRVADVYLGEFMRLYSHHAFRESLAWRKPDEKPKFLRTDDWWRDYFGDTERSARRRFFART